MLPKIRDAVLERDGECLNCGGVIGLTPHHIRTQGAGGADSLENLISLCFYCHRATHDGYIVPGRRMQRSSARRAGVVVLQGEGMRDYFRGVLTDRYGYIYEELCG